MRYVLLTLMLMTTFNHAEVNTKTSKSSVTPDIKPSYDSLTRDDYDYNPLYNDEEIAQKKKEQAQEEERRALKKAQDAKNLEKQKALQKKNKAAYDKKMKAYENRKRKTNAQNVIIISDTPEK